MRSHLRYASVIGAFALSTVAISPALAAAPVSQAGANAVYVSVAGNANDSGNVTATNDGSKETKTGDASPPISVLGGQKLLNVGVLAQEATARTDGTSAACAGIAGNGGSVVQVGSSSCLAPGEPVGLSFGNLDLSKLLVVDPTSALGPLAQANAPLQSVLGQITKPLAAAIKGTPLGTTGLTGTLTAVEGTCTARPGKALGDANIVDAKLVLDVAGTKVVLANLEPHPAPNTHVPVNLDNATKAITDAVATQLTTMLAAPDAKTTGPLAPLALLPTTLQTKVIDALVAATKDQLLKPLADNILDITLNKQSGIGTDVIKVTALDAQIVPAAKAQLGASLAELHLGNVACGPGRAAQEAAPAPAVAPPALPTAVSAGYATMPGQHPTPGDDSHNAIVLGAFALLVATGAGFVTMRRIRG